MAKRYRIDTWADSHGLWHARIRDGRQLPENRLTRADINRLRAAARRAILAELKQREDNSRPSIRLQILWGDSMQHGARYGHYIGAPDTLHFKEF